MGTTCGAGWHPAPRLRTGAGPTCSQRPTGGSPTRRRFDNLPTTSARFPHGIRQKCLHHNGGPSPAPQERGCGRASAMRALAPRDPAPDGAKRIKYQVEVPVLWETAGRSHDEMPGCGKTVERESRAAFQYRRLTMASPEFQSVVPDGSRVSITRTTKDVIPMLPKVNYFFAISRPQVQTCVVF